MLSDGSIDIRHLTTFLAVAEVRSFGRAAERLGYTQSAVSQQIAALERSIGADVFIRPGGPRPVELTDAGRVLLEHATAIVARLRRADAELQAFCHGTFGRIRIGSFQSASVKLLPLLVQRLATELPDVEVELVENDSREVLLELLEQRQLDAAFIVSRLPDPAFRQHALFDDPFLAVAPRGSLPPGPILATTLVDQPLIGQHDNDMCQRSIEAGIRAAGIDGRYVFRSADNAAVQAMARAGRGIAVMPQLAVDANDQAVTLHEIRDLPAREVVLVWRDDADVPPAIGRFVDLSIELGRSLSSGAAA